MTTDEEITDQCCSYCSEWFPADEPMVDYDGQTFCSPNCVRDMLNDADSTDHAQYVEAVGNFNNMLGRIMSQEPPT